MGQRGPSLSHPTKVRLVSQRLSSSVPCFLTDVRVPSDIVLGKDEKVLRSRRV